MNFYTLPHKHYCGVALHSRTMYLCIVGRDGAVLLHRNLPCNRDRFLLAIAPYREDLVVAVECVYVGTGSPTSAPGKASPSSSATPST